MLDSARPAMREFRYGLCLAECKLLKRELYSSKRNCCFAGQSATKEPITNMLRKTSRSEETLLFARNFLQHPMMLGSLIPSSRFLISRLLSKVDWSRARTIVEYGPGVGT